MKFQNRSIHGSKVNRRTHRHTDRQAESNMPFQLFQSWGHKKDYLRITESQPYVPNTNDLRVLCHWLVLICSLCVKCVTLHVHVSSTCSRHSVQYFHFFSNLKTVN